MYQFVINSLHVYAYMCEFFFVFLSIFLCIPLLNVLCLLMIYNGMKGVLFLAPVLYFLCHIQTAETLFHE